MFFWQTKFTMKKKLSETDLRITNWMASKGILLLRISVGLIFIWFGVLKFFPSLSPAETLASDTISLLTFGLISGETAMIILAAWETLIGLGLITGIMLRETLLLLFLQMAGTLLPLVLFPGLAFSIFPVVPTLEGQYIIKNLIIIAAGIVIGATVRGGRLTDEP